MSAIKAGDRVRIRDASGKWREAVARSGVRYDNASLFGRQAPFLSVSVQSATMEHPVNWPAEDVESVGKGEDE